METSPGINITNTTDETEGTGDQTKAQIIDKDDINKDENYEKIARLSEVEKDNDKDASEDKKENKEMHVNENESDGKSIEEEKSNKENSEDVKGDKEISESEKCDSEEGHEKSAPDLSSENNYELIDGEYHYTDSSTGVRYKYSTDKTEWVEVEQDSQQVTTDSEGRTYYYADGLYLCRDSEDNVFFMNEKNEWRPWEERTGNKSDGNHWYFYQGSEMFYRDRTTGAVFKFNKEENKWEKFEGKLKRKRPKIDPDEEFDTDEEFEGSDEESYDLAPPGADSDPSIKYDGVTYTKSDPSDKMEYEWDVNRRAWFPKVDEDFMATYQLSYGFNPDGTKNENPLKFDDGEEELEEERRREEEEKKKLEEKGKQTKKKPTWFEVDESTNTKVYVSNLPDDMTEKTFLSLMEKCGMVHLGSDSGKPKIKLYHDKEGNFKGDALCTYIKVESVKLALQILDESDVGGRRIRVEPAKFQQKGEYDPKLKPRKKPKKELEKLQRRQEKLFDWRPDPLRGERRKHESTVILRNVFNPKEFETAMEKILDHKENIRSQCTNFGNVKKLELYDLHPAGVVQVMFEEVESADMCVATLNKRLYCGRTLNVTTWDGKEKFRIEETPAEKEARLKKWDQFLVEGKSEKTTVEEM
ncbi:hypothetical protein Pmani_028655 [Petrolisthes manimaculis]|uniref:RRM domain-containing protein n=1 Tax=Petrolisthes manimaculis TaxID=1843537 RepID=A0AAE1P1M7_9EUCA|nr:hypothetical protein Pmani_028655 [Petrolisthes manimaculis]